jgi:hypothetical protein
MKTRMFIFFIVIGYMSGISQTSGKPVIGDPMPVQLGCHRYKQVVEVCISGDYVCNSSITVEDGDGRSTGQMRIVQCAQNPPECREGTIETIEVTEMDPYCCDRDADGYFSTGAPCYGDDCNDDLPYGPYVYPGAPEICDDNVDNDCDGIPIPF